MNFYDKLRPSTVAEPCDCKAINRILLVYTLSDNPIHCYECKGGLDPERLNLDARQVDQVVKWHNVFRSLYELWLDSGEYETWAKASLVDKNGQVNHDGLSLAAEMSNYWPTYYWWFYEHDDPTPNSCPNCGCALDNDNRHGHGKCEVCHVVV